eukprot:CAMPEP_0180598808 /NCGR_PEP_ID=MMETSP1037_2-20121125/23063_1 /TAXON_ID=632150 /ORGANISM="Azadinium spinosum, Strain 3D9" /LENGTH=322 /DNA_ID=CAMNT_0022617443 /DNA_START=97 /DNA_END=1061 /DNA_ORIENTATION=+
MATDSLEQTLNRHKEGITRSYRQAQRRENREPGRETYAAWKEKGFCWDTEDYMKPSFQDCYVEKNFTQRALAAYQLLELAMEKHFLDWMPDAPQCVDFCGGPGNLSDGVAQFLKERARLASDSVHSMTVFDPVQQWDIAVNYLNEEERCFDFKFKLKQDLLEMAGSVEVGLASIVTIVSAIVDFLEKAQAQIFWEHVAAQIVRRDSKSVVLVFDRFEFKPGEWVLALPHVQPFRGPKIRGLYSYLVFINAPLPVPRALKDVRTPVPITPPRRTANARNSGSPMTPDPVEQRSRSSVNIEPQVWVTKTGKKFHREGCKWAQTG